MEEEINAIDVVMGVKSVVIKQTSQIIDTVKKLLMFILIYFCKVKIAFDSNSDNCHCFG